MTFDLPRTGEKLEAVLEADFLGGDGRVTARHFREIGAGFGGFAWSPPSEALEEEVLRVLLAYWSGLPVGKNLPPAVAVSPARMKPALGHVMLLDVVEDGRDFRYRVYGSAIAARAGFDAGGRRLTEMPVAPLIPYFLAGYRACLRRAEPLFTRHAPPVMVHVVGWDRLILPLEGEDGRVVRLLVGNVPRSWSD